MEETGSCPPPFCLPTNDATVMAASASLVKKVEGGKLNFPTDSRKFPTEEIMGDQNFNFAPKFSQNGGFSASNFVFEHENFSTKRKFSDRLKFREGGNCPLSPTDDVTVNGGAYGVRGWRSHVPIMKTNSYEQCRRRVVVLASAVSLAHRSAGDPYYHAACLDTTHRARCVTCVRSTDALTVDSHYLIR